VVVRVTIYNIDSSGEYILVVYDSREVYIMSTSDIICKDGASKSNDDGVCEMNDMLQNISTADNEDNISVCANCGKEGSDVNNICNKCKMVKYCNAACKKKHRSKHKKECEEHVRLAAEQAAKLQDEKLFKLPPPQFGDCPICFIRLPSLHTGSKYQTCCGKFICSGCAYAPLYDNQGNEVDNEKCPFCRVPTPTKEEMNRRIKKRMEMNDPMAMYNLACDYRDGTCGFPQDYTKALELYHRTGELGNADAYCDVGYAYKYGEGVEIDEEKAKHYWELAAMRGNAMARHNLGIMEVYAGNADRALKHYMIAVGSGHNKSLNKIKELYSSGHATKDDYTKALQLYQAYLGEIKSKQRDEAAAANDQNCYY